MKLRKSIKSFYEICRERTFTRGEDYVTHSCENSLEIIYCELEGEIKKYIYKKWGIHLDGSIDVAELVKKKVNIDPREDMNKILREALEDDEGSILDFTKEEIQDYENFALISFQEIGYSLEKLREDVKKYIGASLDYYLSETFIRYISLFSRESIEKMIEFGSNHVYDLLMIFLAQSGVDDDGNKYPIAKWIKDDLSFTKKADLYYIFIQLYGDTFEIDDFIDLEQNACINALNRFNTRNYFTINKFEELPPNLFTDEHKLDIQKLIELIIQEQNIELIFLEQNIEYDEQIIKETLFWLYHFYAFFGTADGLVPGIKDQGIDAKNLATDLSDFLEFIELKDKLNL